MVNSPLTESMHGTAADRFIIRLGQSVGPIPEVNFRIWRMRDERGVEPRVWDRVLPEPGFAPGGTAMECFHRTRDVDGDAPRFICGQHLSLKGLPSREDC
jgi:hypothetical protein